MVPTRSTIRLSHRGFTLLEVLIAFAVLGLGLIMIAAIFPAALLEHSRTIDRSKALDLATNAEALLHNRIDPSRLYVNSVDLANGFDSPWYAIPFHNMTANNLNTFAAGTQYESDWDNAVYGLIDHDNDPATLDVHPTQIYYSLINNIPIGYYVNRPQLYGVDYLSDSIMPRTDAITNTAPSRLVWHGFYRTTASGTRHFTVAVCKQRQNKEYPRQRVDIPNGALTAYALPRIEQLGFDGAANSRRARFPVPWRVNVGREPGSQILHIPEITNNAAFNTFNNANAPTPLAFIAPKGSKLLIQGRTYTNTGSGVLDFPGGRILTVVDTDGYNRIQVLEDISDLEPYDLNDEAFSFDVWLFPPSILGDIGFEKESPIIEWKVSL